jgi:hypothetical protein
MLLPDSGDVSYILCSYEVPSRKKEEKRKKKKDLHNK